MMDSVFTTAAVFCVKSCQDTVRFLLPCPEPRFTIWHLAVVAFFSSLIGAIAQWWNGRNQ